VLQLVNFDEVPTARSIYYGDNAGAKEAVLFNGRVWMIKYKRFV